MASPRSDSMSSINGWGKDIGFTILWSVLKSTYILSLLSFFLTTTKEKDHGDCDLSITFASEISSIALSMIFLLFKVVLYDGLVGFVTHSPTYLRPPKGSCCSILDDFSCSFMVFFFKGLLFPKSIRIFTVELCPKSLSVLADRSLFLH